MSLAHAIASATGARLLLVGVRHNPPLPFPGSYSEQREDFEHALKAVRDELAPDALVHPESDLSPAHALRRVAEAEHADLLVVGSRHRRRLRRIIENDQAMQVLHGAPCAVAVAPDPMAPRPTLRRIGVGIDATPESEHALGMARELAERTGASLWLHVVVDETIPGWAGFVPMAPSAGAFQEITEGRLSIARSLLAERLEACEGVAADGTVVVG
ncbi:MAG: universal stress protein, partial [Solirubrobacteraceae bacterium]